jgi:hypothetical protein
MDATDLLSRQRRPPSYRIPIQRLDGRCDRVRASTHRWLDATPTSKGARLDLTLPTLMHDARCTGTAGPIIGQLLGTDSREHIKRDTKKWPSETGAEMTLPWPNFRTRRPSHIRETSRFRAVFERSSKVMRWRRTGWLGRRDSNLCISKSDLLHPA